MALIKSISGIRGTIGGKAGEGLNPLDIVNMIVFLASDKAGFITGENICIDGGQTKPVDPILEFKRVEVGEFVFGSNTYTTLYPFYKDFGETGVMVFAVILGLLFGYLFKTSEDNSDFALILYAILAGSIAMQFIGDTFFTVLSQNIQYLVAALLPFIISKYNLFSNLIKRNG